MAAVQKAPQKITGWHAIAGYIDRSERHARRLRKQARLPVRVFRGIAETTDVELDEWRASETRIAA